MALRDEQRQSYDLKNLRAWLQDRINELAAQQSKVRQEKNMQKKKLQKGQSD